MWYMLQSFSSQKRTLFLILQNELPSGGFYRWLQMTSDSFRGEMTNWPRYKRILSQIDGHNKTRFGLYSVHLTSFGKFSYDSSTHCLSLSMCYTSCWPLNCSRYAWEIKRKFTWDHLILPDYRIAQNNGHLPGSLCLQKCLST